MKWLRRWFPSFLKIHALWCKYLTAGGKAVTIALLLCVPSLGRLDSPQFLLFSTLISLLAVAAVVGRWYRPQLSIRVRAPGTVAAGTPVTLTICVENRSARAVCDASFDLVELPQSWNLAQPETFLELLEPGESAQLPITLCPVRRGRFLIPPVQVTTTFPFNLIRLSRTYLVGSELIVLPRYRPLAACDLSRLVPSRAEHLRTETFANHLAMVGQHDEYSGNREYLPGMLVRRWDYGSWARLGTPVVREFSDPQRPTAAILVDAFDLPSGQESVPVLEAGISLAAALAEALTGQGHRLAFLVGQSVCDLQSLPPTQQFSSVLRELAIIEPCSAGFSSIQQQLDTITAETVFCILHRWDQARSEACESLTRRGCHVVRLFVEEGSSHANRQRLGEVHVSSQAIAEGTVTLR